MSKINVTTLFQSTRDGRWYMIVTHGCIVEHIRLIDEDGGPSVLHSNFGIPLARAKRMCEKAKVKA